MQEEGPCIEKTTKRLKSMKVESIFKPTLKKLKHRSAILKNQIANSDALNNQIINILIEELLKEAEQQIDYRHSAMFRVSFLLHSQQELLSRMIVHENEDENEILCIVDEEPPSEYYPKVIKKDEQTKKIPKRPSRFRQFSILKSSEQLLSEQKQQNELADENIELQKKQRDTLINKLKKQYLYVIQNKIKKEPVQIIADYRPDFQIQESEEIAIFRKNIFKSKRVSKVLATSAHIQNTSENNLSVSFGNLNCLKNREYLQKIDSTMSNVIEIKQNNRGFPRHSSLHHEITFEEGIKMKLSDLKEVEYFAKPTKEVIKARLKGSFIGSCQISGESILGKMKTEAKQNISQKSVHFEKKTKIQTQKSAVSKNHSISFLPKISKR